ncbi:VOC family protein [Paraburkholderia bannensis]|uniref:VOC family protein n=1 Tax=Paraburkholderia bannensis TaxID=765414 RepID=UPI002AB7C8E7|nr:VOC family protein [Paraburkholderia bannensis]
MTRAPASWPALQFHHHGLAVKSPDEAARFLEALGYARPTALFDPLQRVNLALYEHVAMPAVELVWPGAQASPIDRILRHGPSIYHTCYATHDANAWLDAMASRDVDILTISPPTPAVLFHGQKVSFHMVSGVGLVELLHLDTALAAPGNETASEHDSALASIR